MTPEKIKAYLDELEAVSEKHGLCLMQWCAGISVEPIAAPFEGYAVEARDFEFTTYPSQAYEIKGLRASQGGQTND